MVAERMDRRTRGELVRIDRIARFSEDRDAWTAVRRHAGHIHLAVRAERPDLALHFAGSIASLADRRLRQLKGPDAA